MFPIPHRSSGAGPVGPAVALLALALALAVPTVAQAPPPEALPGVFGEVVEVRVINLEVVVTDEDGVRVTGLGKEAFRLIVDGEEVPIDYFTEVRGGTAVEPPEDTSSVPAVLPGEPVGTSYLVFVDNYFSIGNDRDRVLEALRGDLAGLGPDDRVAIVEYDGYDLEMVSSWASSPEAISRAIDEAKESRSFGLQRLAERRQADLDDILRATGVIDDGDFSPGEEIRERFLHRLDPDERFYASRLADQVQRSVAAATATLRSFASPPGRKVMLVLSGGWPFLPAEFVVAEFSRPIFLEPGISSGDDLFRPLTDTANLLGYTLYPVDVPGLDSQTTDVRAFQPSDIRGRFADGFLREREAHASLDFLARQTGGRAYINADNVRALERTIADTRSYYWLGFTPERSADDRRHDVRVEMRDPSLEVRSRGGYVSNSRQREVTMQVESALLFGNPPSTEPLSIAFGRPSRAGWGKMELPLEVGIPLAPLTLVPDGDGARVANLELRVAVIDEEGRQADVPVIPLAMRVPSDAPDAGVVPYETTLKMRRQHHRVVVAIYDVPSGRILSGAAEIDP